MRMRKILLFCFLCIAAVFVVADTTPSDELSDEMIVNKVSEQEFNMDEYMQELEAIGGKDYERYKSLRERFNEDERRREEAKAEKEQLRWLVILLSLAVALVPTFTLLKHVVTGDIKPAGPVAVLKTIGVMLFWGIVLFGINYFWLWTTFTGDTKIMSVVLGLALLLFVIYAIHSVHQYNKKHNRSSK